jgi:hypothetical protein
MLPVDDGMDVCIAELDRCVAKGARAGFIPGFPVQPYHSQYYDPLYARVAEAGLPLTFHRTFGGKPSEADYDELVDSPFEIGLGRLVSFDKADFVGRRALQAVETDELGYSGIRRHRLTSSELERVVGDTGIKITFLGGQSLSGLVGAPPSAVPPELLGAVTTITRKMWGNIPVVPEMSTGATDGKFLRAAGIPTFGVSGIFSEGGENNMHGRDEKLRVKSYYDGLAFLDQLVRMLAVRPKM